MLLSRKTTIQLNNEISNVIGHMNYAAWKLWNCCNYERMNYKTLTFPNGVEYPNWYYQKKAHKDDLWYKSMPAQTSQEVCKQLDKAWKSFYALKNSKGIENPQPPKFKHKGMAITYMQKGIVHECGSDKIRLSLSKQLKQYMLDTYGISITYLNFKNPIFKMTDKIKQIKIYPPENNKCEIVVVYEVEDVQMLPDNGKYLSIDLGLHNLFTCYDATTGETFIVGRKYLSICNYYNKEISRIQSQWALTQNRHNVKYPKPSKHVLQLYHKKKNTINDYLHKATNLIVKYCVSHDIHTVVIGDITGIRKDANLGATTNQKLHSLPYSQICIKLNYKLALQGIRFITQKESYSSQISPLQPTVCKENASKNKRVKRGLYKDGQECWNADCVGAYNILRLYFQKTKTVDTDALSSMRVPTVIKVAV